MATRRDSPEPQESVLKIMMRLRGLDISQESKFDFEAPVGSHKWPLAPYGPDSPHVQYSKAGKGNRTKHQASSPKSTRPAKSRKPKASKVVPNKAVPNPLTSHGPVPKRDPPLQLLTLPAELRNRIYELLAVLDEPIHPSIRPIWTINGRQKQIQQRSYPREPTAAMANHQMRKEILSTLYASNKFIFQQSDQITLTKYSIITTMNSRTWIASRPEAHNIRSIELRIPVITFSNLINTKGITYTFLHRPDDTVRITRKYGLLLQKYCACLEDTAVAEVTTRMNDRIAAGMSPLTPLAAMALLLERRREKLAEIAREVHAPQSPALSLRDFDWGGGHFWAAERGVGCARCGRLRLPMVGGG
ncbi:hypothetical protein LTR62_000682 [Meristemomyces frigidus]|uniref:Uncharacterized protein n=1 Tax=Meristemomyces frigidus TaxID=1508187 RepID=A0AAN7T9W3_9PEZI|nr:hypothetical protein LTR62_000682 [Meristemomyces frigidus]